MLCSTRPRRTNLGATVGHRRAVFVAVVLVVASAAPLRSASAAEVVQWAPAATAAIHPGMQTVAGDAQCTANFVYTDKTGTVYIGQASHCTSNTGELAESGCTAESLPLGTAVTLGDSGVTGVLAYSSWLTMQRLGEKDEATCFRNDFALIKLPSSAVAQVNPSVPVFGGPVGLATGGLPEGAAVVGYGNSGLRGGVEALSPQRGVSLGGDGTGWYYQVYMVPPGVPGDSGGGYLTGDGQAVGELVSVNGIPPGSNGLIDIGRALGYAQAHSGLKGLELVKGTEPFTR